MECIFCDNQQGRYYQYNGRLKCRTIFEDDYWISYPTIGAFVEGYVLHVLKRHTTASVLCTKSEIDALISNIHVLSEKYKTVYGVEYAYIFEHGSVNSAYESACCISHTHVHMLPTKKNIDDVLNSRYLSSACKFKSLNDVYRFIEGKEMKSYILAGSVHSSQYWILDTTINVYPSQYMRQVMYSMLVGDPNTYKWDWRRFPYLENISRITKTLSEGQ